MKCTNCGKENDPTEKFCIECGMPLGEPTEPPKVEPPAQPPGVKPVVAEIQCPNPDCRKMNPPGTPFCVECGADLSQAVPAPPVAEPAVTAPPVARARLILPDNSEILLTEATKMIGRSDFERAVSADDLKYISRVQADQGRFQFRTSFENGKFYVEDLNSANSTKLNGVEIKGKGKQELKDSDKLEVAEVAAVTFKMS